MSVSTSAGPRSFFTLGAAQPEEAGDEWANVRPLDRSAAGAVGEWVELLARISHDLRTPLNAVIGFSDVMQQELFGPLGHARYHEYVRHIRDSGVELLQAAEDALEMTALLAEPRAKVALEDVPLRATLCEALDDLALRYRAKEIEVELDFPREFEIHSDRRLLDRALRQLATLAMSRAADGALVKFIAEARHGLVDLRVEISAVLQPVSPFPAGPESTGTGRQDLAVWLATSVLDLIDCRLSIDAGAGGMALRTTMEEVVQPSFFPSGYAVSG